MCNFWSLNNSTFLHEYCFSGIAIRIAIFFSNTEQIRSICNKCIKGLLKCILRPEDQSESYLEILERGIIDLNGKKLYY